MIKNKAIIIIVSVFLFIGVASLLFATYLSQKIENNSGIDSEKEARIEEIADVLMPSGEVLMDEVMPDISGDELEMRLLDVLAPFGALDPVANQGAGGEDIKAVINTMFGYFFSKYDIPEETTLDIAELPLEFALSSFDEDDYFRQNAATMQKLVDAVDADVDLEVIAFWTSYLARVNNEFYDLEEGVMWELEETEDEFHDFAAANVSPLETDAVSYEESLILGDMASISVVTIYKCDDVHILIVGATANNGFGFIKGGENAEDVNCGLLTNRFRIMKEKEFADDWIYWVGR